MNYILFDDAHRDFQPLSFTKPIAEFRIGILTIRQKWEKWLNATTSTLTEPYLSAKYPLKVDSQKSNIFINGSVCPNKKLIDEIQLLNAGEMLVLNNAIVAYHAGTNKSLSFEELNGCKKTAKLIDSQSNPLKLNTLWDIFSKNAQAIIDDFELVTTGRISNTLSHTNQAISTHRIFIEEGARIECAILNATDGPIYIAKNAEVMEGSCIRGPFSLGENSVVKMGAKIYGPTTIGPHSKVGGEINNSVVFGYSNKAHDGFLGNSVIGEWCNLGADTNNSNLKNNYAEVKLWSYQHEKFVKTGLVFCGLIMGDHSKCGINTMFNTGTVVGINANIFGAGFPRNFVPDFSWGGAHGFVNYKLEDAFDVITKVMERRNMKLNADEKEILTHVCKITEKYRK